VIQGSPAGVIDRVRLGSALNKTCKTHLLVWSLAVELDRQAMGSNLGSYLVRLALSGEVRPARRY